MVQGAVFSQPDEIPFCPTTLTSIPDRVIAFDQTKNRKDISALVHFYQDDYKFVNAMWHRPWQMLKRLRNFGGIITPDFSTYLDMPRAIKVMNTYKMRALGLWLGKQGIPVVNNVRWGNKDSYSYAFAGLPTNSILAVSTHGCINETANRLRYECGLATMIERLTPHTLIVYGSAPKSIFNCYQDAGIHIVNYPSQISLVMKTWRGSNV
ncbi:MAG: DUF4417 domain-containing protein [Thermoguttaceae bacterium]|nr:DUF4417 domain-containing protein [Thermoguttaceae bacterium]